MTKSQGSVLIALLVLGIFLFVLFTFRTTQWEYHLEDIPDAEFSQRVNRLGSEGWDMVFARRATITNSPGSTPNDVAYEVIMKRRSTP